MANEFHFEDTRLAILEPEQPHPELDFWSDYNNDGYPQMCTIHIYIVDGVEHYFAKRNTVGIKDRLLPLIYGVHFTWAEDE
ncbi:hypothetical protein [Vibrio phage VCPH]|nr:hypothetical protein [Vibrio phage VCPH]